MTSETTEAPQRVPKWVIDLNAQKIDLRMKLSASRIQTKAIKDELSDLDRKMTHQIDESGQPNLFEPDEETGEEGSDDYEEYEGTQE